MFLIILWVWMLQAVSLKAAVCLLSCSQSLPYLIPCIVVISCFEKGFWFSRYPGLLNLLQMCPCMTAFNVASWITLAEHEFVFVQRENGTVCEWRLLLLRSVLILSLQHFLLFETLSVSCLLCPVLFCELFVSFWLAFSFTVFSLSCLISAVSSSHCVSSHPWSSLCTVLCHFGRFQSVCVFTLVCSFFFFFFKVGLLPSTQYECLIFYLFHL